MKFRTCVDCGQYKYIESNGLCRDCYNNQKPSYSYTYTDMEKRPSLAGSTNQLSVGERGSGKTVANKLEICELAENTNSNVYIVDGTGQYQKLIDKLGGTAQELSHYDCLNLMRIEPSTNNNGSLATKVGAVVDIIMRCYDISGLNMTPMKHKILAESVETTYRENGIKGHPSTYTKTSPTITDLIKTIDKMSSNAGKYLNPSGRDIKRIEKTLKHLSLELTDIDNRVGVTQNINKDFQNESLVYFNASKTGAIRRRGLRMQMVLNEIFEYAKSHKGQDWIYIDNAELLFASPPSSLQSTEIIFRHSRHEGLGICLSMIRDNCTMESSEWQSIATNCQYKRIHKLNNSGGIVQNVLNLSDKQRKFIENADTGKSSDEMEVLSSGPRSQNSEEEVKVDSDFLSEIH